MARVRTGVTCKVHEDVIDTAVHMITQVTRTTMENDKAVGCRAGSRVQAKRRRRRADTVVRITRTFMDAGVAVIMMRCLHLVAGHRLRIARPSAAAKHARAATVQPGSVLESAIALTAAALGGHLPIRGIPRSLVCARVFVVYVEGVGPHVAHEQVSVPKEA
jgi:hypothetical protein